MDHQLKFGNYVFTGDVYKSNLCINVVEALLEDGTEL